jgi:hypothetical protein
MSRSLSLAALTAAAVLAGCGERPTAPMPGADPSAGPEAAIAVLSPDAARERLARRLAISLGNPAFRARLKRDLDRSQAREGKVHFQRYLAGGAAGELARSGGASEAVVQSEARLAAPLELYLPVPEHRRRWAGDDRVLVATARADHEAPVGFTPRGERLVLSATTPPATPVLALVPAETDFDETASLIFDGGGPAPAPPPGLYMTYSHFVETFEGWLKGAPEFEIHMLGQAGTTDSLTSYGCAGERAGGFYQFNQDNLDWSGNVLLITQTALNNYKSAHPNQNMRVFVVEDDDTSCQIKTDASRFVNLVKAVEAAYPLLTGGKDSTSGAIQRIWKRATVLQKLIRAIASVINTNDELVGNAVESAVVGITYPGANWVVKGEGNKTNGWINLVMRQ